MHLSELLLGVLHAQGDDVFCESLVCLLISACLHVSLSESLLGVLHARYVCTWASCCWEFSTLRLIVYFICVFYCVLVVSHTRVSFLVRVWALDVWGELVPSKIFNPPFPVLKAGHSVSYSCVCDVIMGVGWWGGFLSILSDFSCLASVLCTCFSCTSCRGLCGLKIHFFPLYC